MRVAIASDDRKMIAHHFGRAQGFVVVDIRDGKEVSREYRENVGRNQGHCGSCDHSAMIANVKDCDIVVSYGMGQRIYNDLVESKVTPVVTEEETVDAAIRQLLEHTLTNRTDKLH